MSRYANYGSLDTPLIEDFDHQFTGLNMKDDRGELESGILARSENKRLNRKVAETRGGILAPTDFNPSVGFGGDIQQAFVYSNPNGSEVMLLAEAGVGHVAVLQENHPVSVVNLPAGETIPSSGIINFVQAFDKVLLLRSGHRPLVWNGSGNFQFVSLSGTGNTLIPNVNAGEAFQARVFYWYRMASDQVIMSDLLDYTSYDPALSVFRINAGKSDRVVRVFGYGTGGVLVFMEQSIHYLSNFTIDSTLSTVEVVSPNIGASSDQCILQIGSDVLFLSDQGGIFRLTQVLQDKIQTPSLAVSDPIQPIIDRINWDAARYATAALNGIYAYFALPIDGAIAPNCVAVLNAFTGQWESIDFWPEGQLYIRKLPVTTYQSAKRMFLVDPYFRQVYLTNEGVTDKLVSGEYPVNDIIETRGYCHKSRGVGFKRFKRLAMSIDAVRPSVNVTAITDGFNEEKLLTSSPITKDPTKYYIHAHKDFEEGVDDPNAPKRKDYTTTITGDFAQQDFEGFTLGTITDLPETLADVSVTGSKQRSLERRSLRVTGEWVSIRVDNNHGQCDVLGIEVDALETLNNVRIAA